MSFARGSRGKKGTDVTDGVGFPPNVLLTIKSWEEKQTLEGQTVFNDDYWQHKKKLKKRIIKAIKDSFNNVKSVIEGNTLDFLKGINSYKKNEKETTTLEQNIYVEDIPIYLVNHELCGEKTSDGKIIPNDTTWVSNYNWEDLRNLVGNDSYDESKEKDFQSRYEKIGTKLKKTLLLGLYQRVCEVKGKEDTDNKSINEIEENTSKSGIFLWVDHIYEESKALGCEFKSLFVLVLFHELMHAFMDVCHGCYHKGGKMYETFEYFKEESLANGLALYLCNEIHDVNITCESALFALEQDKPYCIGWKYKNKEILKIAVENWMKIKRNGIDNYYIHEWFKTIAQGLYTSNETILQAEKAIKKRLMNTKI